MTKKKRILGIDVARSIAIMGMIIVNFKVVLGEQDAGAGLKWFAHLFDGKAAATFVVLAGVGIALLSNSAIAQSDKTRIAGIKKSLFKRALVLFFLGLSYMPIWPADILHFYGIYMLLTLLLLQASEKALFRTIILLVLGFPLLTHFIPYEQSWNFATFTYADFWTVKGFFRNLFYNGFHPVIPWAAFMLYGLWLGRRNWYDEKVVRRAMRYSLVVFIGVQFLSWSLIESFSIGLSGEDLAIISIFFGTNPMPPMPLYMVNGISIATFIIAFCVWISPRFEEAGWFQALAKTGRLALTFYVGHVILGMGGALEGFGAKEGSYTLAFSLGYAVVFSLSCVLFAVIWSRYFKQGPLEWCMRKLTS